MKNLPDKLVIFAAYAGGTWLLSTLFYWKAAIGLTLILMACTRRVVIALKEKDKP